MRYQQIINNTLVVAVSTMPTRILKKLKIENSTREKKNLYIWYIHQKRDRKRSIKHVRCTNNKLRFGMTENKPLQHTFMTINIEYSEKKNRKKNKSFI